VDHCGQLPGITLALPGGFHLDHIHTNARAQALAWLIGSALMIAYTLIMWLVRGRAAHAAAGRRDPRGYLASQADPATDPFALIRALAVSAAGGGRPP
jgi:hypothetical protein